MIVSFDFDETIHLEGEINYTIRNLIFEYAEAGHTIYIVTARSGRNEGDWYPSIKEFIRDYGLPIKDVIFTNHELKGPFLRNIGADVHYDDKIEHLDSCIPYKISTFLVDGEDVFEYNGVVVD